MTRRYQLTAGGFVARPPPIRSARPSPISSCIVIAETCPKRTGSRTRLACALVTAPTPRSSIEARSAAIVALRSARGVLLRGAWPTCSRRRSTLGRPWPSSAIRSPPISKAPPRRKSVTTMPSPSTANRAYLADEQLPTALNAARFPFEQIVINLGTNDVMTSDHDLDETIETLRQITDAVAGHPLRSLGDDERRDDQRHGRRRRPRAAVSNDAIREIAATHPNVTVDRLGHDRTHLRARPGRDDHHRHRASERHRQPRPGPRPTANRSQPVRPDRRARRGDAAR